jgi:hypothetical protein
MTPAELEAIEARANAATPASQWGQLWDGKPGCGEIRVGPWYVPATARVLDFRHGHRRRTVITSNRNIEQLKKWLGPRLVDRLNEGMWHETAERSMRSAPSSTNEARHQ